MSLTLHTTCQNSWVLNAKHARNIFKWNIMLPEFVWRLPCCSSWGFLQNELSTSWRHQKKNCKQAAPHRAADWLVKLTFARESNSCVHGNQDNDRPNNINNIDTARSSKIDCNIVCTRKNGARWILLKGRCMGIQLDSCEDHHLGVWMQHVNLQAPMLVQDKQTETWRVLVMAVLSELWIAFYIFYPQARA